MQQSTSIPVCDKLETEHLQFSCALNTCLCKQQLIAVCLFVAASDWIRCEYFWHTPGGPRGEAQCHCPCHYTAGGSWAMVIGCLSRDLLAHQLELVGFWCWCRSCSRWNTASSFWNCIYSNNERHCHHICTAWTAALACSWDNAHLGLKSCIMFQWQSL